jgi:hypothetical protein
VDFIFRVYARKQREAGSKKRPDFALHLFFGPKDGGGVFLRNVG